jgi:hypothetical protein
MSLQTGPPDSTGGCQSALVDKLGVSPGPSSMVHIINHPGMNIRPVEAVGLRRQSCPIIANPKLMCHVSMTKITWLLLCRETIAVYFEMHMKSINTICGKNTVTEC